MTSHKGRQPVHKCMYMYYRIAAMKVHSNSLSKSTA